VEVEARRDDEHAEAGERVDPLPLEVVARVAVPECGGG
jgi:hypothetical protein